MMKYLFILLIFIYKIQAIKFINFIPFTNSECTGSNGDGSSGNEGVGYSIVIDTCFSFDNSTNHIVSEKDGNVFWENFYNILDADSCMIPQGPPNSIVLGECTSMVVSNLFNSFYTSLGTQLFYMTSVTDEPIIPSNSFVTSFMSGQCTVGSVLLVEYIINGTQIGYGSKSKVVNYFCDSNDQPFTQLCPGGNECFKPTASVETCIKTKSFFNDSSETSENTGSGNSIISTDVSSTLSSSSPSSSHPTSSISSSSSSDSGSSGSGSGGDVSTGGSSGTGGPGGPTGGGPTGGTGDTSTGTGSSGISSGNFKININVNSNNNNNNNNNNNQIITQQQQLQSSTSSSPSLYYKSVYCT